MNRKALSTVVTSLIIIILSLVAIGVLWAAISGFIGKGGGQIGTMASCFNLQMQISSASCVSETCTVVMTRTDSEGDIAGVNFVFKDEDGISSDVIDKAGSVDSLKGETFTFGSDIIGDVTSSTATSVEATPYVLDSASGKAINCGTIKYALA